MMWNCDRDGHVWQLGTGECQMCGAAWDNPDDPLPKARAAYLRGEIDLEEFEFHVEHALRGHRDGCLCWDCVPPGGGPNKPWSTVVSSRLLD